MAARPSLVLVGGFLGAGKTTLLHYAARLLTNRGLRVAIIVNDQDHELVDTRYMRAGLFATEEIAGGCFCCRFSELLDRAVNLARFHPDVIFAEPVGSCIDLSATVLQPLKALHADAFRTAPLTVLIDPELASQVFRQEAAPEVRYLFEQQIREADLVCVGKADLYPELPELPVPLDFQISAVSGHGVDEWLEDVLSGRRAVGTRLLDVDYEEYARSEAALGWLNLHSDVHLTEPRSPAVFAGPLLDELKEALTRDRISLAHLKLFDETAGGYVKVSVCGSEAEPIPEGDLLAESAVAHKLAINLRALADPAVLASIVKQVLARVQGRIEITHLHAFRPPPPKPEHRFASVVPNIA